MLIAGEASGVPILNDYPSFNLRLARVAAQMGVKVEYFISPKVWAWKEFRVKKIKKYVDDLYCILPFEIPFYKGQGYAEHRPASRFARRGDTQQSSADDSGG